MSLYTVEVGVSLSAKRRPDLYVKVVVEARSGLEAELIACQMAACVRDPRDGNPMPVSSTVTDWQEDAA